MPNNYSESRMQARLDMLGKIAHSDYLKEVLLDLGFDPKLKRFDVIVRSVRVLTDDLYRLGSKCTAKYIYEKVSQETGDGVRWIVKQINLALQSVYKSKKIKKMNEYARFALIDDSGYPMGNYMFLCEMRRILLLKAIDEVNAAENRTNGSDAERSRQG